MTPKIHAVRSQTAPVRGEQKRLDNIVINYHEQKAALTKDADNLLSQVDAWLKANGQAQ